MHHTLSKLRVVHIISGDLWAGAESMAFNLLKHLKEYRELDLAIILLNEGRLAEELRGIGATIHIVDEKHLSFWEIARRTRKILLKAPPDLIHSHRYKENILAKFASGFKDNVKFIATQHGLPELSDNKATFMNLFVTKANFHLLSKYFTKTVAVSADVKNHLIKRCAFGENCVEYIHNGIEIPEANLFRSTSGKFVIGSSGRLCPVKDYPLMIEIARKIAAANSHDTYFELAGEGPERAVLESMIASSGLQDRFAMKGHLDNMGSFYRGIDLYLNTSLHEGIPMTILEALACGIPVIAPAVGGIGEIITDGVEGFLIKSRNPDDFAEKCLLLRENSELRKQMSKAARKKTEQAFSADKMAEKYFRLYCNTSPQQVNGMPQMC